MPWRVREPSDWFRKFDVALRQNSYTEQALSSLEGAGIDRRTLLYFLHRYSDPSSIKHQRALRRRAGRAAVPLMKLVRDMRRAADEIASAAADLAARPGALQSYEESSVIDGLRMAADRVDDLSKRYKRFSSQKGKARDDEALVFLCLKIKAKTGRAHLEDLAYLLDIAFSVSGNDDQEWDEDSLAAVVKRYKKSWPEYYRQTLESITDLHSGMPLPPRTRRSTANRRSRK